MDVKNAFLIGYNKEEAYVKQPPGFEDPKGPNHVYKLNNTLNGLKQALRPWYERLSKFLIFLWFPKGKIDTTLFTNGSKNKLLVVQVCG